MSIDEIYNSEKTFIELLEWAETIAKTISSGHLTIFKFTTNWRGVYGTPDGDLIEKFYHKDFPAFQTKRELLSAMISNPDKFIYMNLPLSNLLS